MFFLLGAVTALCVMISRIGYEGTGNDWFIIIGVPIVAILLILMLFSEKLLDMIDSRA